MKTIKSWENFSTTLVICFMLVILGGAVTNCGTRSTEIKKEHVKKDSVISTLTHVKIKVDSNYTIDFSSFKIYPIDVSKPILINNVKIKNGIIDIISKKETLLYSKIDKTKIEQVKKGSGIESKKDKETQKSDTSNLWIGIAFVIGLVIYFLIRKSIFRN